MAPLQAPYRNRQMVISGFKYHSVLHLNIGPFSSNKSVSPDFPRHLMIFTVSIKIIRESRFKYKVEKFKKKKYSKINKICNALALWRYITMPSSQLFNDI